MNESVRKALNKKEITVIEDAPLKYALFTTIVGGIASGLVVLGVSALGRKLFDLEELKFSFEDRITDEDEEDDEVPQ